ncbi:MAG TPA: Rieske 2Fe-2S domain-containing protein [Acidobacteriota bacterium]
MIDGWVRLGPCSLWDPSSGRPFDVRGRELAVFRTEAGFYALQHRCPHRGGPLALGMVCDGAVTCPWHEWRFELKSGQSLVNPKLRIRTYPTEVRGDEVWVRLDPTG